MEMDVDKLMDTDRDGERDGEEGEERGCCAGTASSVRQ